MLIGKIGEKNIYSDTVSSASLEPFLGSDLVKTGLLTVLSGYLESDKISVNGNKIFEVKKLERFLSYILNDKRAAPRKFKLDIKFNSSFNKVQNKPIGNSYNCFVAVSGGIDSSAGLMYAIDKGFRVKPVFISFGQKNEEREIRIIEKICLQMGLNLSIIKVNLSKYVDKGWDRWKLGIIPARNFLFACIIAELAKSSVEKNIKLFICAHREEITSINTDKSKRFYSTCSQIFSNTDKIITVTTPFERVTKSEIISYWLKYWIKKYHLLPQQTVSCYLGTNCGECKACINRLISFICASAGQEEYIKNPFKNCGGILSEGYIKRFSTLNEQRKLELLYAIDKNRNVLPLDIARFLGKNYPKYYKKIKKHINSIKHIKSFN